MGGSDRPADDKASDDGAGNDSGAAASSLTSQIRAARLHPILQPVLLLMQTEGGAWFSGQLPGERVAQIKAHLENARKDRTLHKALVDLLTTAVAVYQQPGGRMVGLHLKALCEATILENGLLDVEPDGELAPGLLERVKVVVGAMEKATPAMVNSARPEGTLRVDQITPPPKRRV